MIGTLLALAVAAQPAPTSSDDEISVTTYEPVSPDSAEQALPYDAEIRLSGSPAMGFPVPKVGWSP